MERAVVWDMMQPIAAIDSATLSNIVLMLDDAEEKNKRLVVWFVVDC